VPKPKRLFFSDLTDWRFGFFLFLAACARISFGRDTLASSPSEPFQAFRIARNLVLNGYFGEGSLPDAYMAPAYPTLLALAYQVAGNFSAKPFFLINMTFDLIAVAFLLQIGRSKIGTLAGFGLFLMALNPLWIAFSIFPNVLNLSFALFSAFLFFRIREKRTRSDEVVSGSLLGLLSLSAGAFYFFPVVVAFLSRGSKRNPSLLHFLIPALAIPLPWILRNFLILGKPVLGTDSFVFSPSFSHLLDFGFRSWNYPFATLWIPQQNAQLYLWIFLTFVPALGVVGLADSFRSGRAGTLERLCLGIAGYLAVIAFLFPLEFPLAWIPHCFVSLWAGHGLAMLCGMTAKEARS
jgi:hypothetical protein